MPKFDYDYYSGDQTEHFRFLPVPKVLYENPEYADLDLTTVFLYSMLHEQVALSKKNGWIDESGRVYVIRTLDSMHEKLKCSKDKARAALNRLIEYGLIEKKRRGQGKPDLLYVKDYASKKQEKPLSENNDDCGKFFSETEKTNVLTTEKPISRDGRIQSQEVGISDPNNTLLNNNNYIEPNHNLIQVTGNITRASEAVDNSGWDEDAIREDIAQIKENIYYDEMSARYRAEYNDRYDELFKTMVDMIAGKRKSLRIGETEYPQWLVRERVLSLTAGHVEYGMGMIAENLGKIHNMRKYMMAALFNAPTTKDSYFTQLVHHDMHTEEWFEMSRKMSQRLELQREAERNAQIQELEEMQLGQLSGSEENMRRAVNE